MNFKEKDDLQKLKELDLFTCSLKEIEDLIKRCLPPPIIKTNYSIGKRFERAIRNENPEIDFNTVERISYCLPQYNKDFKRASTPENTMFYGSVVEDALNCEDFIKKIDLARITAACETSELLRDKQILEGRRVITIGTWEVRETIELGTIFDVNENHNINYLNEIKVFLLKEYEAYDENIKKDGLEYLSYLAKEFSKDVKEFENNEYRISALFTQLISNKGIDGIIYPSVKSAGNGLCIAIQPRLMQKLQLIEVNKCLIEKKNGLIDIRYIKRCDVEDGATEFKLLDIKDYVSLKKSCFT